ncbi:hypothetical protein OROGR_014384 [Orobanche gracilis]
MASNSFDSDSETLTVVLRRKTDAKKKVDSKKKDVGHDAGNVSSENDEHDVASFENGGYKSYSDEMHTPMSTDDESVSMHNYPSFNEESEFGEVSCSVQGAWLSMGCFIKPVNSEEYWTETDKPRPEPPKLKRPIGRPKKKRRKDGESEQVPTLSQKKVKRTWQVLCYRCGEYGHMEKKCVGEALPIPARQCRPKKNQEETGEVGSIPQPVTDLNEQVENASYTSVVPESITPTHQPTEKLRPIRAPAPTHTAPLVTTTTKSMVDTAQNMDIPPESTGPVSSNSGFLFIPTPGIGPPAPK